MTLYLVRTFPDKLDRNARARLDRVVYGYKKMEYRLKEPKELCREGLVELGEWSDNVGKCNFIISCTEEVIQKIIDEIKKFEIPFKVFEINLYEEIV